MVKLELFQSHLSFFFFKKVYHELNVKAKNGSCIFRCKASAQ